MGECFNKVFVNFCLTERVTACNFRHQIDNVDNLCIIKVSLSVFLTSFEVLILNTDQTLLNTDRLSVLYKSYLPLYLADFNWLSFFFIRMKRYHSSQKRLIVCSQWLACLQNLSTMLCKFFESRLRVLFCNFICFLQRLCVENLTNSKGWCTCLVFLLPVANANTLLAPKQKWA